MQIFITGATGYIGGDFLFLLSQRHPLWDVTCLVRDREKARRLTDAYPRVRIVLGDLDSASILVTEASEADIVYNFAHADHLGAAKALVEGVARNRKQHCYLIHTSGAGILTHENFASQSFGNALASDSKVYDDLENVQELTTLPDKALHRHVDKVILTAAPRTTRQSLKTAIVAPSCIYGTGRGTGNQTSVQIHVAAKVALQAGKGVQVGSGANIWHEVHIHDLSELYLLLGEAAAQGGGRASWNSTGYYLAESGSFVWGQAIASIARQAYVMGLIASCDVESVDAEKAKTYHPLFPYLCATTSRGLAKRAKSHLGWNPVKKKLDDHIPEILLQEARKLGMSERIEPKSSL